MGTHSYERVNFVVPSAGDYQVPGHDTRYFYYIAHHMIPVSFVRESCSERLTIIPTLKSSQSTMLSLRQASRTLLIRATNSLTQQPGRNFKNALTRNLVIQHSSLSTTTGSGGSSSTVSKGPWGWITSKLADREKEKQEKQFRDQLVRMAASEQWTLKDFGKDLDLTLKGWQMYIPGLKDTKEFKTARTAQVAVKAIGDEIGLEGSCDEVKKLGRTEKVSVIDALHHEKDEFICLRLLSFGDWYFV